MTDFDWIGAEWVGLGMVIFLAGSLAASVALILRTTPKRRVARRSLPGATRG